MFRKGFTLIELMIVLVIVAVITAIALPNQIRSREAANETAAIASCHAVATAQNIYRRTDYNHDGVLEFAQHIKGDNSLFENAAGLEDIVLVDRGLANAEGDPQTTATAKAGYVFKILTAQGATASGGAFSYIDGNGRMTLGYGISAVPDQYDGTGRNAFLLSAEGAIYQNDRGPGNTAHEPTYDPDSTWVISE